MITSELLRLFPAPANKVSLAGLYLAQRLHQLGSSVTPFVYANFLSSLDGRIALEDIELGTSYIPNHLTSASDFALFMELHAQADCLITHGGYMRAVQQHKLGNILQVKNSTLLQWRKDNGLPLQPAVVIASASLNFQMHPSLMEHGQSVYIATGKLADPARIQYWKNFGYRVLIVGNERHVQGQPLIKELAKLGYKSIYLIAGPQLLETIIRDRQLSRFYLTLSHQLLGGNYFCTLLTGQPIGNAGRLNLQALHYLENTAAEAGQFFLQFGVESAVSLDG